MMTMVEMEDPGLVILPTHRMVSGIHNFSLDSLIDNLMEHFYIDEHDVGAYNAKDISYTIQNILDDKGLHTFVLYLVR